MDYNMPAPMGYLYTETTIENSQWSWTAPAVPHTHYTKMYTERQVEKMIDAAVKEALKPDVITQYFGPQH